MLVACLNPVFAGGLAMLGLPACCGCSELAALCLERGGCSKHLPVQGAEETSAVLGDVGLAALDMSRGACPADRLSHRMHAGIHGSRTNLHMHDLGWRLGAGTEARRTEGQLDQVSAYSAVSAGCGVKCS